MAVAGPGGREEWDVQTMEGGRLAAKRGKKKSRPCKVEKRLVGFTKDLDV